MEQNKRNRLITISICILACVIAGYAGRQYSKKEAVASANDSEVNATEAEVIAPLPERKKTILPKEPVSSASDAEMEGHPVFGTLNAAHYHQSEPDGTESEDSFAELLLGALSDLDDSWMSEIYSLCDSYPAGVFNQIKMDVTDGSGKPISLRSNSKEILSMTDVYACDNEIEDYARFLSYAEYLWEGSHSYWYEISDLYYCDGCLEEKETLTEETAWSLASGSDAGTDLASESNSSKSNASENHASESNASESNISENHASEKNVSENSTLETSASEHRVVESSVSKENETENAAPESREPESAAALEKRIAASDSFADQTDPMPEESLLPEKSLLPEESLSPEETPESEKTPESEEAPVSEELPQQEPETESASEEKPEDCCGHMDLVIHITIRGVTEADGLYELAALYEEPESGSDWSGWDEEKRNWAQVLISQDWEDVYGLTLPSIKMRNTLTDAEIDAIYQMLPKNLSETRRSIVLQALASVGRIPYYYGGKPASAGYEGNHFGSGIAPDSKGRTMKGLDCSGWINWVYWSVLGKRPSYQSTSTLASAGKAIAPEQLQPGDIAVRTGKDAHVVMFLCWMEDGSMMIVHESSFDAGNVTLTTTTTPRWRYFRSLLNE